MHCGSDTGFLHVNTHSYALSHSEGYSEVKCGCLWVWVRLLYKRGRGTENSEHGEGAFCAVYSKRKAQSEQVLWLLFRNILDARQSLFTCTITPNIRRFLFDKSNLFCPAIFEHLVSLYLWFHLTHALHGEEKVTPHVSPLTDLAAQTEDEGVRAEWDEYKGSKTRERRIRKWVTLSVKKSPFWVKSRQISESLEWNLTNMNEGWGG